MLFNRELRTVACNNNNVVDDDERCLDDTGATISFKAPNL
jgi:hypothetical protein